LIFFALSLLSVPVVAQETVPAGNVAPPAPPVEEAPPAGATTAPPVEKSPTAERGGPGKGSEGQPADGQTEQEERSVKYEGHDFLFNTETDFAGILDQGTIPEGLRREFAVNRSSLSRGATVSVESPGKRWSINDLSRDYVILRQRDNLGVYRQPRPVQRVPRSDFAVEPLRDLLPFGYEFFSQAPSSFAPVSETPVPATYALGPGDELKIRYWSPVRAETVHEVVVNPTGEIYLPVAGVLTVQGLPFDQAQKVIADALKRYYRNLEVEVTLTKLRTLRVFVAGEAARPGAYTLSALSTAFNALYVAGGPNARGSMRNIRLIRQGKEAGVIDLYEYLLTGNRSVDFELQQDDTIFIPVVGPVVAVYGAVKRSALYELKGGERLKDAIELSGGPLSSAFLGRVQVDRVEGGIRRTVRDINITQVQSKDDADNNPLLQDGDAIGLFEVAARRTGVVQIEGPVEKPGSYELRPGMKVSDLIAQARGLRADVEIYQQRADILRLLPDTRLQRVTVDLQKALQKDPIKDLPLQEYDRLVLYTGEDVPLYGYVEVRGNVERPGLYQRTEKMTISDLLFVAGLPRISTYLERADLIRTRPDETTEIIAVNLAKMGSGEAKSDIELQDRDTLRVYTVAEADAKWSSRRVTIEGAVQRPGTYPWQENMKLQDLLFATGGVLSGAYRPRADLVRTHLDETQEILPVNIAAATDGDVTSNLPLNPRDVIKVYTLEEAEARWHYRWVTIAGAVQRPDKYPRQENMTLKDIIFAAGGLLPEAASEAEIARPQGERTVILTSNLEALFQSGDERQNVVLQNRDHILVKTRREYVVEPSKVTLSGEFRFPGTYALRGRREKLSDLLERAGGMTAEAFQGGVVFRRRLDSLVVPAQTNQADKIKDQMEAVTRKRYEAYVVAKNAQIPPSLSPAQASPSAETTAFTQAATVAQAGEAAAVAARPIGEVIPTQRLALNLPNIIEGKQDIYLEEGDTLHLPKRPTTVIIAGAVVNPGPLLFAGEKTVSYYVNRSGGYSFDAEPSRSVAVRANGLVTRVKKDTKMQLGDILVVPTRSMVYTAKKNWLDTFGQFAGIVANVASTAYILLAIN